MESSDSKGYGSAGGESRLEDWIMLNLCNKSEDRNWPTKFLIMLWYIWKWRNGVCFEGTSLNVQDKVGFLLSKYKEHIAAIHCEERAQPSQSVSYTHLTLPTKRIV